MILDLINENRATLNKDPEYNVQMKSKFPIRKVEYKPECGEDSFEIMQHNMDVYIEFVDDNHIGHLCERLIEEFDKLILIRREYPQIEYELKDIKNIVVF